MPPLVRLCSSFRRRQAQQGSRFKRLDLVALGILQRLSASINVPSRGYIDADNGK